jgi:hypothetical protein
MMKTAQAKKIHEQKRTFGTMIGGGFSPFWSNPKNETENARNAADNVRIVFSYPS